MSALNLPKPVNSYAGEDVLRSQNGGPSTNGNHAGVNGEEDIGEYRAPRMSDKYKVGMIYPPKEMRNVIDKTANHVSKSPSPQLLEDKIREQLKTDPKFAFLNDEDPYHAYYRYMVEKIREDAEDAAKGILPTPAPAKKADEQEEVINAYEPKAWEFKVDLPGVTAQDLDILRLTALFHARRGRSFLSSLSVREGRNYQFNFLRPTHSLFGYYNRMVESYIKVMQPAPGVIEGLIKEGTDPELKWKILDEARNRAEWERGKRKREGEKQKEKDEEAEAMAVIDWQDFVTVETIEFTQNDMELELPPPTSVERLKSMSMAEKRMASMVMEETGAGPTAMGQSHVPEPVMEEMEMEEEEDEEVRLQRIKAEQEQAKARDVQRAAMQSRGMKIRTDYVPKGIQRTGAVATAKCPYCGQSIPENELSEHIRIELLDPKWKEQKRQLDQRKAQALQMQHGADVSTSLKNLAQARTDIFGDEIDEAERKRREEEEIKKRREREKIVWDGHTNSAAKTETTFQTQFSLDEQIKKMHSRMGLTAEQAAAQQPSVGPQAGPGIVPAPPPIQPPAPGPSLPNLANLPPALAASLPTPGGGTAYSGATISAGPTGPTTREYISSPYGASAPAASVPASASPSSGPSIHPSRMAAMATAGSASPIPPTPTPAPAPVSTGQVRPREEEVERPVVKRAKVDKLPFGQYYSEIDWMSLHPTPITLTVQLPAYPEKPEWKLDGSVITIPDVPVSTLFSNLRERIKATVGADLPISRLRLDFMGKVMNNGATLASVNIDEGDVIYLNVRKK